MGMDLQERQRQAAREATAEHGTARDETIPGGRYVLDDGETIVDANGKRIETPAVATATPVAAAAPGVETPHAPPADSLAALGLPTATEAALRENGFASAEALRGASDDELDALPGIGAATVQQIRAALTAQN